MEANRRPDARSSTVLTSATTALRSPAPYNVPNAALVGALAAFAKPRPKSLSVTSVRTKGDGVRLSARPPQTTGRQTESAVKSTSLGGLGNALAARRTTVSGTESKRIKIQPALAAAIERTDSLIEAHEPGNRARTIRPPAVEETSSHSTTTLSSLHSESFRRGLASSDASSMDGMAESTSSSIAESTQAPVDMFEKQSAGSGNATLSRSSSVAHGRPRPAVAPKSQRAVSLYMDSPDTKTPDTPPRSKPLIPAHHGKGKEGNHPGHAVPAPEIETATVSSKSKPASPPVRRAGGVVNRTSIPAMTMSSESLAMSCGTMRRGTAAKPATQENHDLPVHARLRSMPRQGSPVPYKGESLQMLSKHITGDSLADALVGANLAIKAAPTSQRSRTPPPVPSPRRKHHLGHAADMFKRPRSLSPQKKQPGKLMSTLREESKDDKQKNKKHRFRQPNKHHEGTRERWRDYVSDLERKRYEGVWAANKGLHLCSSSSSSSSRSSSSSPSPSPSPSSGEEVCNLVVREVWSRSRIPQERLARIWDLVTAPPESEVEGGEAGPRKVLSKEQFVVGMWLIDQTLKGRNLPHRVHATVWESVRLRGVKIRLEGKGKDGRRLERAEQW